MPDEGPPRRWPPPALLATIQLRMDDPYDRTELVGEARQEGRTGTEGAPLANDANQPSGVGVLGFPADVTGKGDAAVRQLNWRSWTGLPGNGGDADRRQPAVQRALCL